MTGLLGPAEGLGIVVGMAAEARLARRITPHVRVAAGLPGEPARLAAQLVAEGATILISFGIAGGLTNDVVPGTLIVADRIVTDDGEFPGTSALAAALGARIGAIYGGLGIVATPDDKRDLHHRTGALAVDMETGGVAWLAAKAGVPFIAIRAIADPAWRTLPPAATLPLDANGHPRLGAVFSSIFRQPNQLPHLIAVARESGAAMRALARVGRILGA